MEKIFNEVVNIVSERTGIDDNDLIHSKLYSPGCFKGVTQSYILV